MILFFFSFLLFRFFLVFTIKREIFVFEDNLLTVTFMDSFYGLELLTQKLFGLVEVVPELHSNFHRLLKK